ncbi:MAG: DUF3822 family protein [Chitinophagaceae bacterium]
MKQVFTISTDQLPTQENSLLSVRIGERHVGFALTDLQDGSLQHLAWFTGETVNLPELDELYRLHPQLALGYAQVKLCYDHSQSLLVPFAFANETANRQMLETGFGITESDDVFTDRISSWQVDNTYAVPHEIHQWASSTFTGAKYIHHHTVSIRNLTAVEEEGYLRVDFRSDDFTVIICRNNELKLAQTFPYSSPSDVIYYLLKSCKEFELPSESTRLSISGLVDKQSILYRELYQYFLGIEFRLPLWPAAAGESYPSHFFTSLNDLARCES